MSKKLVTYIRVSTKSQGASGLGLEAQQAAVQAYATASGGEVIAELREIESGKNSNRPVLAAALAQARRAGATLVIAKLDRLSRNVAFLSRLMDAGVDFVACDNANANRLTLHILSAVAEDEARRISERTKAALVAAKKRGQLLGSARPGHWKGNEDARLRGLARGRDVAAQVNRQTAIDAVADLLPEIQRRHDAGESLRTIAEALNAKKQFSSRGGAWNAVQIKRVLDRVAVAAK